MIVIAPNLARMDIEEKKQQPEQTSEEERSVDSSAESEAREEREVEKELEGGAAQTEVPVGEPLHKKESVNNVAAIPNGGLTAWLQVLGSFFLFCNTW